MKNTIVYLFTDFGNEGVYTGQVEALIAQQLPNTKTINLLNNAPVWNPQASAYLLKALASYLPGPYALLAIVDPGVGGLRLPIVVETSSGIFIGPNNGLLAFLARTKANSTKVWVIDDGQYIKKSETFHGRDLFTPALIDWLKQRKDNFRPLLTNQVVGYDWPGNLEQIIYTDHFGNAFTGIGADVLADEDSLVVNGQKIVYARTYVEVLPGNMFWYRNSIGLVELAINQGRADAELSVGTGIRIEKSI